MIQRSGSFGNFGMDVNKCEEKCT